MNVNFAVIAYKKENGIIPIVAEGDRQKLQELLPIIKEDLPNAKLISVDEEDYERCKNDIEFQNEFLSTRM